MSERSPFRVRAEIHWVLSDLPDLAINFDRARHTTSVPASRVAALEKGARMLNVMQKSLIMLSCAAFGGSLAGCTQSSPTPGDSPSTVEMSIESVDGELTITFDGPVHEVVVEECAAESCTQEVFHGEHLLSDSTYVTWETGVGDAPFEGSEWRAAPTITGEVRYGVLPTGAGYSSAHDPLRPDTTYSINAYRYGDCDDGSPQCFHITAVGGAFFRLGEGESFSVELLEDPYPY